MAEKWNQMLALYDKVVKENPNFERKGKTMPYTSANGYMFSQLNKNGELGIRFSEDRKKTLLKEWDSTIYISYGAVMKGYVTVPNKILNNEKLLAKYLQEGYEYVMTLEPK